MSGESSHTTRIDARIKYHNVTRERLIAFQREAHAHGDAIAVDIAAECIRLMGLARFWKQRAERPVVDAYRQKLWDIYGIIGCDQDGDPTPRAVVGDLAFVVDAVREFRAQYDEAEREAAVAEQIAAALWTVRRQCHVQHAGHALTVVSEEQLAEIDAALAEFTSAQPTEEQ